MRIRLRADWLIPAGTVFENVDGETREYVSGNFEAILGPSKDTVAHIAVEERVLADRPDLFEALDLEPCPRCRAKEAPPPPPVSPLRALEAIRSLSAVGGAADLLNQTIALMSINAIAAIAILRAANPPPSPGGSAP